MSEQFCPAPPPRSESFHGEIQADARSDLKNGFHALCSCSWAPKELEEKSGRSKDHETTSKDHETTMGSVGTSSSTVVCASVSTESMAHVLILNALRRLKDIRNVCQESDWQYSQTFRSIEQRRRGDFWFQPMVLTRLKVVTENW